MFSDHDASSQLSREYSNYRVNRGERDGQAGWLLSTT